MGEQKMKTARSGEGCAPFLVSEMGRQAASAPEALAMWVAIASIKAGDKQS